MYEIECKQDRVVQSCLEQGWSRWFTRHIFAILRLSYHHD